MTYGLLLNQDFLAINNVEALLESIDSLASEVINNSVLGIVIKNITNACVRLLLKVTTQIEQLEVIEDYPVTFHLCALAESDAEI